MLNEAPFCFTSQSQTGLPLFQATLKSSADAGRKTDEGDVGEVEAKLKRLETFGRLLDSVQERIQTLKSNADELVEAKHMESPNIGLFLSVRS